MLKTRIILPLLIMLSGCSSLQNENDYIVLNGEKYVYSEMAEKEVSFNENNELLMLQVLAKSELAKDICIGLDDQTIETLNTVIGVTNAEFAKYAEDYKEPNFTKTIKEMKEGLKRYYKKEKSKEICDFAEKEMTLF